MRIPRLIRYKLELLALPFLSVLASDRNGPGVSIYPCIPLVILNLSIPIAILNLSTPLLALNLGIPLVVLILSIPLVVLNLSIPLIVLNSSMLLVFQMANLARKGKTMLNSRMVRYPI